MKKTRKRILDQSEAEKLKKVVLKQKNFTRRWWRCVRGEGGWEVGGWAVERDKSVRTVGWLGR